MSYATYYFTESLNRVGIEPHEIDSVLSAWGAGDGMGTDAGHFKWAADGATDWKGGFLLSLKDGLYVYLTGWCDYTGWGCQDGAEVYRFINRPTFDELRAVDSGLPAESEWDAEPADLNLWLLAQPAAKEQA